MTLRKKLKYSEYNYYYYLLQNEADPTQLWPFLLSSGCPLRGTVTHLTAQ